MAAETQTTTKLNINVLGKSEYDNIINKNKAELYVVKEDNSDADNAISSRTYADVGRDAIFVGTDTPTSQYTKIWVDTDDQTNFVHPADTDMDNLTPLGQENLKKAITPNFSAGTVVSNVVGETYTVPNTGWIYASIDESSELELFDTNTSGARLITLKSYNEKLSDNIMVSKNMTIFVSKRSGTTRITFYPCSGVTNA